MLQVHCWFHPHNSWSCFAGNMLICRHNCGCSAPLSKKWNICIAQSSPAARTYAKPCHPYNFHSFDDCCWYLSPHSPLLPPWCPTHTPDPDRFTWTWTRPGMGQCLDLHADVTFRRRARPPFWEFTSTHHEPHGRSAGFESQPRRSGQTSCDRARSSRPTGRLSEKRDEAPAFCRALRLGAGFCVRVCVWGRRVRVARCNSRLRQLPNQH